MSNILRAASVAAVVLSAAGTFLATDPGFALGASTEAAAPVITIDRAVIEADAVHDELAGTEKVSTDGEKNLQDLVDTALKAVVDAEEAPEISVASLSELVSLTPHQTDLDAETQCLAGTVFFESKGESLAGQLAVGRVVLNRVASSRFPNTVCGVVYQRSQFSFVRGGKMPSINTASKSWKNAVAIAQIARDEAWTNRAKGALFFHATRVSPRWRLTRVAQIDNHIFYR